MSAYDVVRAVSIVLHEEAERQGRQWDYPGVHVAVKAALEEDGRTCRQVVTAGLAAIDDKNAKSPGALRWSNRYAMTPDGTPAPIGPCCRTCARSEPAHDLAEAKLHPDQQHPFEIDTPATHAAEVTR